jgi:hypothetical protein
MDVEHRVSHLNAEALAARIAFIKHDIDLAFTMLSTAAIERKHGDRRGQDEATVRVARIIESMPGLLELVQRELGEADRLLIECRLEELRKALADIQGEPLV